MRSPLGLVVAVASAVALLTGAPPATAAQPALTFALIGDTPYDTVQRLRFPALVDEINADPAVRMVLHAGDVKSGSSTCSNLRYADLVRLYNTFADPFVLTPGDNEWTDCHRVAAGGYLPIERLVALRKYFFPVPGMSLGQNPAPVLDQPSVQPQHADYVENVAFERNDVLFATVHVVGSENDLAPWDELAGGDLPRLRLAEFASRRAANLDWINAAFARAEADGSAGVLLMLQAEPTDSQGFGAERALILQRAADFGRPVLLVHGDEHVYEMEPGYGGVPNLTRLETFGDTATKWLRVTVDPSSPAVFSWAPQTVR